MDIIVEEISQYLINYYNKEENEEENKEEINFFGYNTILILNKVEENYWNLIVIFY